MATHPETRGARVVEADRRFWIGGLPARLFAGSRQHLIDRVDAGLARGTLTLIEPDGRIQRLGGRGPGPQAELRLSNWRPFLRLAAGGSAGWARAYFDGDWTSPDVPAFFEVMMLNRRELGSTGRGALPGRLFNRLMRALQANTLTGARRNIQFHYDLGNDFYAAWLDETMAYSSAIFSTPDELLADAQRRKVRVLLDRLEMKPGERLLEIGCGWGGLAEIAAKEYGVHVTGITLSREQLEYGQRRMAAARLSDRVDLRIADYREDIGRFDHMASVEMFEAVGARYWKTFMRSAFRALKPGGRAAMQVITIDEAVFPAYRSGADFIQTYIFPGGILPSEPRLRTSAENAGFRWEGAEAFGQHYAETLRQWRLRYDAARQESRLPPGFDAAFDTIWRYYLMYCEGGFRSGGIDVVQTLLKRP